MDLLDVMGYHNLKMALRNISSLQNHTTEKTTPFDIEESGSRSCVCDENLANVMVLKKYTIYQHELPKFVLFL